jgi:LETM1 and EF-hand domain-containing protein 1
VAPGFKLLYAETRIASKILMRVLQGKIITRRERAMLQRVISDLLRMIPFSFFILIPVRSVRVMLKIHVRARRQVPPDARLAGQAMELLLPVALYLFPSMLPSQFENKLEKEGKAKRGLKARIEVAKVRGILVATAAKFAQGADAQVARSSCRSVCPTTLRSGWTAAAARSRKPTICYGRADR